MNLFKPELREIKRYELAEGINPLEGLLDLLNKQEQEKLEFLEKGQEFQTEQQVLENKRAIRAFKKYMGQTRFHLDFVPQDVFDAYGGRETDFLNDYTFSRNSVKKRMCRCNLEHSHSATLAEQLTSTGAWGLRIADPYKKIRAEFIIDGNDIVYGPWLGEGSPLDAERDAYRFSGDHYFTTTPFEEIILDVIKKADKCRIFSGYAAGELYEKIPIIEEISKEEMSKLITDSDFRQEVAQKYRESIQNADKEMVENLRKRFDNGVRWKNRL